MVCRHYHFPSCFGESVYWEDIYNISLRNSLVPIGLLAELLFLLVHCFIPMVKDYLRAAEK
jgi:hypothetical protein